MAKNKAARVEQRKAALAVAKPEKLREELSRLRSAEERGQITNEARQKLPKLEEAYKESLRRTRVRARLRPLPRRAGALRAHTPWCC